MGYFWGLVKKEYIEIRYSYKQLFMYAVLPLLFIFVVTKSESDFVFLIPIKNFYYLISIYCSSPMSANFLMESILSDKKNQNFERYFVSGNIKDIMLAKLSAMSILSIAPFFIFNAYFLIKGINIIDTVFWQ